jgi:membrane-associated phospholipid phosphatase
MTPSSLPDPLLLPPTLADDFWGFVSRFGEAQILLPSLAAVTLWWFFTRPATRPIAAVWLACLAAATVLTTLSKLAFIGWGLGWAALDFTGISGHSMFAATVLPMLLAAATATRAVGVRRAGFVAALAFAALVAVSRVMVDAHSVSESVAGFATGALASGLALRWAAAPAVRLPLGLFAGVALGLAFLLAKTPTAPTHALVTRIAMALAGNSQPYTREMLRQGLGAEAAR